MKYIIMIMILFVPNVFASDDGIACTYSSNGKVVHFGYYVNSNGKAIISNFVVDGESYPYIYNKISDLSPSECPTVNEVSFYGDSNIHYYLTKDDETFKSFVDYDNMLFDDYGNFMGQVINSKKPDIVNSSDYIHYETSEITASSGVAASTRKQMETNIKAYEKGACTGDEKKAISEYFFSNDYYSISTFYGSNLFKIDDKFITLSNECALTASDLYNSTVGLVHMLSDYVDNGGDVNTLNYLSLRSSFYTAYSALTTPWYSINYDQDVCNIISGDVRGFLNEFFNTFRIIAVCLTIFMVYLDGINCLTKKDDSETKKWISKGIKRMIALVIILMLPSLINIVLDLVNKYMSGTYVNVNGECVKAITGG